MAKTEANNQDIDRMRRILICARNAGIKELEKEMATSKNDDHDCYPHWIVLDKKEHGRDLDVMKKLQKEFAWLQVDRRGGIVMILPDRDIKNRLHDLSYKNAVAEIFEQNGITCYVEVNWR
jgi:hypothetical protein